MSYNYNAHNFKSQDILTGLERKVKLIKKKKNDKYIQQDTFFYNFYNR